MGDFIPNDLCEHFEFNHCNCGLYREPLMANNIF